MCHPETTDFGRILGNEENSIEGYRSNEPKARFFPLPERPASPGREISG
jgi:hypothetical protein